MFQRILLASVVAGAATGIALTALQSVAVAPLLFAAETYETGVGDPGLLPHRHGELTHSHAGGIVHTSTTAMLSFRPATGRRRRRRGDAPAGAGSAHADGHGHDHGGAWAPHDGIERTFWTGVSNIATAIGFALLVVAVFAWRGGATWRQGLLWGAAGFLVFFVNPAIGMRPEIPGAFAAGLLDRQLWWLLTVVCSAAGVGLLILAPKALAKVGGAALLVVPHLAGAPHPEVEGGFAPGSLADSFVVAPRPPTRPSGSSSGSSPPWRSPGSRGPDPAPPPGIRSRRTPIRPTTMAETRNEEEINRRANEKARKRKAVRDRILATKTVEKGLLIVHTGKGKGKSTAAFGLVARAIGNGQRVGVVQYVKGKWQTGERAVLERFPDQVDIRTMGEGFTWETQDRARDIRAAEAAWETSKAMIEACRGETPRYDLVLLDELNIVLRYGYLPLDEVCAFLSGKPPGLHVVVTGRNAKDELLDIADTVTEMTMVKHHFRAGVKAQKGIEF